MALINIIITEVTNMSTGQVCVAGWSQQYSKMLRPLSAQGKHWPASLADTGHLKVGNEIQLDSTEQQSQRGMPHATEDTIVRGVPTLIEAQEPLTRRHHIQPSLARTIGEAFAGNIQDNKFIVAGTVCPSLGGATLNPRRMGFEERQKPDGPQLRCWLYDNANEKYNLPVTGRDLNRQWRDQGLAALEATRMRSRQAFARIGLAHPFGDGRAYLMLNNVLFL